MMPVPPPLTVQVPVPWLYDWLPVTAGLPMSAEFQLAALPSVHMTRDCPDGNEPTVVTLADTTSSPCPAALELVGRLAVRVGVPRCRRCPRRGRW